MPKLQRVGLAIPGMQKRTGRKRIQLAAVEGSAWSCRWRDKPEEEESEESKIESCHGDEAPKTASSVMVDRSDCCPYLPYCCDFVELDEGLGTGGTWEKAAYWLVARCCASLSSCTGFTWDIPVAFFHQNSSLLSFYTTSPCFRQH